MADIVKEKNTLSLEMEFTDGDTRTINFDNPKDNLAASQINSLGSFMAENKLVVGDKAGADVMRFKTAKITRGTTTYLDLND